MLKTLLLSDIHVTDVDQGIIGLDPLNRFENVLRHAVTHHADAERVVILGDLTHHGLETQYLRLKRALDACPLPIEMTIGNHDSRAVFNRIFNPDEPADRFARSSWVDANDRVFLLLDTVDEDGIAPKHGGALCEERLAWISDQIKTTAPRSVVMMMHHPPVPTGFDGMDRIGLLNGGVLVDLLLATNIPCHLICGHVHRTISGNMRGIPFTVLKSPCHQQPMDFSSASSGLSIDETGAYGVLLSHPDGVSVHTEDVFDTPHIVSEDARSQN